MIWFLRCPPSPHHNIYMIYQIKLLLDLLVVTGIVVLPLRVDSQLLHQLLLLTTSVHDLLLDLQESREYLLRNLSSLNLKKITFSIINY